MSIIQRIPVPFIQTHQILTVCYICSVLLSHCLCVYTHTYTLYYFFLKKVYCIQHTSLYSSTPACLLKTKIFSYIPFIVIKFRKFNIIQYSYLIFHSHSNSVSCSNVLHRILSLWCWSQSKITHHI